MCLCEESQCMGEGTLLGNRRGREGVQTVHAMLCLSVFRTLQQMPSTLEEATCPRGERPIVVRVDAKATLELLKGHTHQTLTFLAAVMRRQIHHHLAQIAETHVIARLEVKHGTILVHRQLKILCTVGALHLPGTLQRAVCLHARDGVHTLLAHVHLSEVIHAQRERAALTALPQGQEPHADQLLQAAVQQRSMHLVKGVRTLRGGESEFGAQKRLHVGAPAQASGGVVGQRAVKETNQKNGEGMIVRGLHGAHVRTRQVLEGARAHLRDDQTTNGGTAHTLTDRVQVADVDAGAMQLAQEHHDVAGARLRRRAQEHKAIGQPLRKLRYQLLAQPGGCIAYLLVVLVVVVATERSERIAA
mmetsp:Transcript_38046/g.95657  ORF Transcript_38046/g.95657 Transcript_38046/m.95657 type:complete len:360 (+) Transcript_38046:1558-2637(+)